MTNDTLSTAAQQPDDGATREAEATTRLSSIRERRLRFILAEFLIGTPTGKTFDLSEMQLLRDDLMAMLGEITFLRAALSQRPRAETPSDAPLADLIASEIVDALAAEASGDYQTPEHIARRAQAVVRHLSTAPQSPENDHA